MEVKLVINANKKDHSRKTAKEILVNLSFKGGPNDFHNSDLEQENETLSYQFEV